MSYNPADWYLKQISVTPGADLDVCPHSPRLNLWSDTTRVTAFLAGMFVFVIRPGAYVGVM